MLYDVSMFKLYNTQTKSLKIVTINMDILKLGQILSQCLLSLILDQARSQSGTCVS